MAAGPVRLLWRRSDDDHPRTDTRRRRTSGAGTSRPAGPFPGDRVNDVPAVSRCCSVSRSGAPSSSIPMLRPKSESTLFCDQLARSCARSCMCRACRRASRVSSLGDESPEPDVVTETLDAYFRFLRRTGRMSHRSMEPTSACCGERRGRRPVRRRTGPWHASSRSSPLVRPLVRTLVQVMAEAREDAEGEWDDPDDLRHENLRILRAMGIDRFDVLARTWGTLPDPERAAEEGWSSDYMARLRHVAQAISPSVPMASLTFPSSETAEQLVRACPPGTFAGETLQPAPRDPGSTAGGCGAPPGGRRQGEADVVRCVGGGQLVVPAVRHGCLVAPRETRWRRMVLVTPGDIAAAADRRPVFVHSCRRCRVLHRSKTPSEQGVVGS